MDCLFSAYGRGLFYYGLLLFMCISAAGCQFPFSKKEPVQDLTPVKNPCIVLALPTSGPYSGISAKIRRGADLARQSLRQKGFDPRIETIDTNNADWLERLNALPAMCAVVGGPIQEKNYTAARNAGQMSKRVFFSFLPVLTKGDEGVIAWRFFPSQQDQIDALMAFASDELKIRTWGAFYPVDSYGQKMTALLEQSLAKRNLTLRKAVYNPATPASWSANLRPLINPKVSEDGKTVLPQTSFEALFIPDSWKHMEGITGSLLENGEDRLVLLGPSLWEQGLAGKQINKANRYALAVFPSAWNSNRAPASLRGPGNDFWTALGYDFMNFASRLGLPAVPGSAAATSTLARNAASAVTALAPIQWDEHGVAHQKMYLFQISAAGQTPLNMTQFMQKRQAIAERAALRMQGWGHIDPDTGEAIAPKGAEEIVNPGENAGAGEGYLSGVPEIRSSSAPASSTPPSITAPPAVQPIPQPAVAPQPPTHMEGLMRTTPSPSYKLSLPNRP